MSSLTTVQIRLTTQDKEAVEQILQQLGLDLPTAIRMYIKTICMQKRIPFALSLQGTTETLPAPEVITVIQREKAKGNFEGPFPSMEDFIQDLDKE